MQRRRAHKDSLASNVKWPAMCLLQPSSDDVLKIWQVGKADSTVNAELQLVMPLAV